MTRPVEEPSGWARMPRPTRRPALLPTVPMSRNAPGRTLSVEVPATLADEEPANNSWIATSPTAWAEEMLTVRSPLTLGELLAESDAVSVVVGRTSPTQLVVVSHVLLPPPLS